MITWLRNLMYGKPETTQPVVEVTKLKRTRKASVKTPATKKAPVKAPTTKKAPVKKPSTIRKLK